MTIRMFRTVLFLCVLGIFVVLAQGKALENNESKDTLELPSLRDVLVNGVPSCSLCLEHAADFLRIKLSSLHVSSLQLLLSSIK
ncbi:unnamed protein product, partial [Cyprideis torosa]